MRIAFLHSCLEPGKDGVGDYTRQLAAESLRQGHQVCLVALNDPFVSGIREEESVFRLGRDKPWADRIQAAKAFLTRFGPNRVSLQFVCYGFHPKGLAFEIAGRLRELIGETPCQLMFHELWIGAERGAAIKARLVGALQRHAVLRLIGLLRPNVVHTTNPVYKHLLNARGVPARELPLFGLIPIEPDGSADWVDAQLQSTRADWIFGIFGALHPVWPPEPLLSLLEEAGRLHRRRIVVTGIGRIGPGQSLWESLAARYGDRFGFVHFGQRSPAEVSQFLQRIDFGIATTPWSIIGKSASVSTMLDHGVPVIVNRDELRFPVPETARDPLLHKLDDELPQKIGGWGRRPPASGLARIGGQFLKDLVPCGCSRAL